MGLGSGLKQRLRNWLGVQELSSYNGSWWGALFGGGDNRSSSGITITVDRAMQVSAVFRCVNILANAMASMPLKLYMRTPDGKEIASDEPLYRVLHDRPNKWQTSVEWRAMMESHRCLRGNAYSLIVSGPGGFASELIPLHPDRMKIEMLENGRLRYVYTDDRGQPIPYTQDQIFHLRGLSLDGIYGLSVLAAARNAIGLTISTEDHGSRLFKNGARPGFALSSDEPIKPEAADKVRESWERMHAGSENQHKTAILPYGLKPVQLGLTSDDAQFLETRKFELSDIARFFGVPPHKIYDLERATFSNIEHQGLEFVQDTLLPIARIWEAAISRDLIVDDETYFAEFSFDFYLRGDSTARAAFYKELSYLGVLNINEIRAYENLNNIGTDGDKRFVQVNMTTLERAGEEPPVQPVAPPAPAESDDEEEDEEEDEPNESGLSAAWAVYELAANKFLRWEVDELGRIAGRPGNFLEAVDAFYLKHSERTAKGMHEYMRLLSALGADPADVSVGPAVEARKQSIIEAAGTCTAANLKTTIEALTSTWLPKGEDHAAA
jgi:HK97 family phage portal protein